MSSYENGEDPYLDEITGMLVYPKSVKGRNAENPIVNQNQSDTNCTNILKSLTTLPSMISPLPSISNLKEENSQNRNLIIDDNQVASESNDKLTFLLKSAMVTDSDCEEEIQPIVETNFSYNMDIVEKELSKITGTPASYDEEEGTDKSSIESVKEEMTEIMDSCVATDCVKDICEQSQMEIANTEFTNRVFEISVFDYFHNVNNFPNIKKRQKRAEPKAKVIKVKKTPMKKNTKKTINKIEKVKISIKHERINYCSPGLTEIFSKTSCPTYLKKYLKKNEQIKKPKQYQRKRKLSTPSKSSGNQKKLKNNVPIVLSIKGNSPNVLNDSVVNPEYLYKSDPNDGIFDTIAICNETNSSSSSHKYVEISKMSCFNETFENGAEITVNSFDNSIMVNNSVDTIQDEPLDLSMKKDSLLDNDNKTLESNEDNYEYCDMDVEEDLTSTTLPSILKSLNKQENSKEQPMSYVPKLKKITSTLSKLVPVNTISGRNSAYDNTSDINTKIDFSSTIPHSDQHHEYLNQGSNLNCSTQKLCNTAVDDFDNITIGELSSGRKSLIQFVLNNSDPGCDGTQNVGDYEVNNINGVHENKFAANGDIHLITTVPIIQASSNNIESSMNCNGRMYPIQLPFEVRNMNNFNINDQNTVFDTTVDENISANNYMGNIINAEDSAKIEKSNEFMFHDIAISRQHNENINFFCDNNRGYIVMDGENNVDEDKILSADNALTILPHENISYSSSGQINNIENGSYGITIEHNVDSLKSSITNGLYPDNLNENENLDISDHTRIFEETNHNIVNLQNHSSNAIIEAPTLQHFEPKGSVSNNGPNDNNTNNIVPNTKNLKAPDITECPNTSSSSSSSSSSEESDCSDNSDSETNDTCSGESDSGNKSEMIKVADCDIQNGNLNDILNLSEDSDDENIDNNKSVCNDLRLSRDSDEDKLNLGNNCNASEESDNDSDKSSGDKNDNEMEDFLTIDSDDYDDFISKTSNDKSTISEDLNSTTRNGRTRFSDVQKIPEMYISDVAVLPNNKKKLNIINFPPHFLVDIFGKVCFSFLNDSCYGNNCQFQHSLPSENIVQTKLMKLTDPNLLLFYKYIKAKKNILCKYVQAILNVFALKKMKENICDAIRTFDDISDLTIRLTSVYLSLSHHLPKNEVLRLLLDNIKLDDHRRIKYLLHWIMASDGGCHLFGGDLLKFHQLNYSFNLPQINGLIDLCLKFKIRNFYNIVLGIVKKYETVYKFSPAKMKKFYGFLELMNNT